jgi:hypothetical protein
VTEDIFNDLLSKVWSLTLLKKFPITFGSFWFEIEVTYPEMLNQIQKLIPPFGVIDQEGQKFLGNIRLIVNPKLFAYIHQVLNSFGTQVHLYGSDHFRVYGLLFEIGGRTFVYNDALKSITVIDIQRMSILIIDSCEKPYSGYLTFQQVVNDVTIRAEERIGGLSIHAAVVDYNRKGLLLVGPKGAGKTTALVDLIFDCNMSFVSGDIALVRQVETGVWVRGIAESIRIAPETLIDRPHVAELTSHVFESSNSTQLPKPSLKLHHLRNAFKDSVVVPETNLAGIVVLRFGHENTLKRLTVDEAVMQIMVEVLTPHHKTRPHWTRMIQCDPELNAASISWFRDCLVQKIPVFSISRTFELGAANQLIAKVYSVV